MKNILFMCIFLVLWAVSNADEPCAPHFVKNKFMVCVCNSTYCDTITSDEPNDGKYIAYSSSESGLRFAKSIGNFDNYDVAASCCSVTLELDVNTKYQTIEGFGGAVTDSAGMNWKNLSEAVQKYLIDSYFSESGIEYNMIRVPIGGTDFSTHPYAYNEVPEDDVKLKNFSLSVEDYQFKIPLIKKAIQSSKTPLHLIATTWSPPPWMKTNHEYFGVGHLKQEYYQTYADYHYKFLEKYAEEGIPIWAITTTNEPISGTLGTNSFNTLGWTASTMGKWLAENLGPTIRNSTFKDLKILVADDQRIVLPYFFNIMVRENPNTLQYIDGIAVHYYTDFITPAIVLTEVNKNYPNIFIIATEACEGSFQWQTERVILGSWERAKNYIIDIIEDLNHNLVGWMDWNICLNEQGGPSWVGNNVDSPILVNADRDEFYKQPMFYAMGHFSKFIPRGSTRVKVTERKFFFEKSVENVAFLTPNNTVVVVLYNEGNEKTVKIKFGNLQAVIKMEKRSVTTIKFSNSLLNITN